MWVKDTIKQMRSLRTDILLKGNEGRADWFISRSMMDACYIYSKDEFEHPLGSKKSCRKHRDWKTRFKNICRSLRQKLHHFALRFKKSVDKGAENT